MFKMGSHVPFGHFKHKLWSKEGLKIKLAIWLPTPKSRDLAQFPCVKVTCNIPLESSWHVTHKTKNPYENIFCF
jgi:hypothetical protein